MKSIYEMKGVEKAAALLIALGPDVASDILKHLDEESVDKLSLEIARLDGLSVTEKEELIGEFLLDLKKERFSSYGGENKARELLTGAFGTEKADDIIKKISFIDIKQEFEFLNSIDSEVLISFLQGEHPQTISVTLSYMEPGKAGEVLKNLEGELAKKAAVGMARMSKIIPEAVARIASGLKARYRAYQKDAYEQINTGGVDSLVEILGHMNISDEQRLMEGFDATLPDISNEIRDKLFTFENIATLTNNEIRVLIDEMNDDHILARALKGAGDDIRFKIVRNLSQNRATDLIEEMEMMGPIHLSEVEESRAHIIALMRILDDNGAISIRGDDEIYVE